MLTISWKCHLHPTKWKRKILGCFGGDHNSYSWVVLAVRRLIAAVSHVLFFSKVKCFSLIQIRIFTLYLPVSSKNRFAIRIVNDAVGQENSLPWLRRFILVLDKFMGLTIYNSAPSAREKPPNQLLLQIPQDY